MRSSVVCDRKMKEKNKMRGRISYKIYKMKKSDLQKKNNLHKHDEVLAMLAKWFSFQKLTKNIALDTNYAWVFKSKSEIIMDVNEYKMLVIPPFSFFGPKTMGKFRMCILNDKYAHINELTKLLKPKSPLSRKISKLIFRDDSNKLDIWYHRLINYLFPLCQKMTKKGCSDVERDTICISKNLYFSAIPNLFKYESLKRWIEDQINKNVHFVFGFKDFLMKGSVKFISLLQVGFCFNFVLLRICVI